MKHNFLLRYGALAALLAFAGTANADSITFDSVSCPGCTLSGAVNNGTGSEAFGNYSNGNAFAYANGSFINFNLQPGWQSLTAVQASGNFILADAFFFDQSSTAAVFDLTGHLVGTDTSLFLQPGAGSGSQFGGFNTSTGAATYGAMDATGHFINLGTVQQQGGELGGEVDGLLGSVEAGTMGTATATRAFLAINGVRQTLDSGSTSFVVGIDAFTGYAYGSRNGQAVYWDATGTYHTIPGVGGVGTVSGYIESSFGGLLTIKDSSGALYTSDGSHTTTFADFYFNQHGSPLLVPVGDAWFTGTGTNADLTFMDGLDAFHGSVGAFDTALGGGTVTTPEPNSFWLLFTALTLALGYAHRTAISRQIAVILNCR